MSLWLYVYCNYCTVSLISDTPSILVHLYCFKQHNFTSMYLRSTYIHVSFTLFNYRQTQSLRLIANITGRNIKKSNRAFMTLRQNHNNVIVYHQMIGNTIVACIIWNNRGEKMAGSISPTQVMNKITPSNKI